MPTYKVVDVDHKKLFGGRMSAKDLEGVLNDEADGGWALDRIVDANTLGFLGKRDVFLLILQK